MTTTPKLRDHIGLLQDNFMSLLNNMFNSIKRFQNNDSDENQKNDEYDLILYAEEIVTIVKCIDTIIDEAEAETCIGKPKEEILAALKENQEAYEKEVESLSGRCEQAKMWLSKIDGLLQVIAENTPWMNQN